MSAFAIILTVIGFWGEFELGAHNLALSGAGITMVKGAEAIFQNSSLIAEGEKLTATVGFFSPFGVSEVKSFGAGIAFSSKRFGVGIGYRAQKLLEIYREENFIAAFSANVLDLKGIRWFIGTNIRIFKVSLENPICFTTTYPLTRTALDWSTTLKTKHFALAVLETNAGNTSDIERKMRYEIRLSPLKGFNSMFTYWDNGFEEGYGIGQEIALLGVVNLRIGYSKDGVTMGFGLNAPTYNIDMGVRASELGSTFHISFTTNLLH